jgi:hypothetical protein
LSQDCEKEFMVNSCKNRKRQILIAGKITKMIPIKSKNVADSNKMLMFTNVHF